MPISAQIVLMVGEGHQDDSEADPDSLLLVPGLQVSTYFIAQMKSSCHLTSGWHPMYDLQPTDLYVSHTVHRGDGNARVFIRWCK